MVEFFRLLCREDIIYSYVVGVSYIFSKFCVLFKNVVGFAFAVYFFPSLSVGLIASFVLK